MPAPRPKSNFTLTAATTSYEVVPFYAARTTVSITNDSGTGKVYLGIGEAAAIGSGYVLNPGQSYRMDQLDLTPSAIFAISDTAGTKLSIQEMGP